MITESNKSQNPWDKLAVYLEKQKDFSKEHIIDPAILEALPPGQNLLIADEGSGPGHLAGKLSEIGHTVHSMDYSSEMLKASARLNDGRNIQHLQCDLLEGIPLADEVYDVAIQELLLQTLPDIIPAVRDSYRILKPGGTCITVIENPYQREQFRRLMGYDPSLYFTTQEARFEWGVEGEVVMTPFIVRPLSFYMDSFRQAGFRMDALIELQVRETATEEFDEIHTPEVYKRLVEKPVFLLLKWIK